MKVTLKVKMPSGQYKFVREGKSKRIFPSFRQAALHAERLGSTAWKADRIL